MDKKRVVVLGADQKQYLGTVSEAGLAQLQKMEPIKLENVYQILMLDQHLVNPQTGQAGGISRSYMLMNIGMSEEGLSELHLLPVGWYDPQTCGLSESFDRMVEQVEKANKDRQSGKRPEPTILPAGAGALRQLDAVPGLRQAFKGK